MFLETKEAGDGIACAPEITFDRLLRKHGLGPIYSPSRGPRTAAERQSLFDGAAGAILSSEPVTADMLAGVAWLKVIARSGVGYDSIDIEAAHRHGIRVCNTPGVNHDAVAEMTMGLMIVAARSLTSVIQSVKDGHWPTPSPSGRSQERHSMSSKMNP